MSRFFKRIKRVFCPCVKEQSSSVPDVTKPPKVKRKRKWWQLGRRNRREEDVSKGRNHVGSSNVDPVTSQVDPVTSQVDPVSPNQTEDTTGSTPQGVREEEPTTPTPTQQTTPTPTQQTTPPNTSSPCPPPPPPSPASFDYLRPSSSKSDGQDVCNNNEEPAGKENMRIQGDADVCGEPGDKVKIMVDVPKHQSMKDDTFRYPVGFIGLKNPFLLCYLNCVVQCLANTPDVLAYFIGMNFDSGGFGNLTQFFSQLLTAIWNKDKFSVDGKVLNLLTNKKKTDYFVNPVNFMEAMCKVAPDFNDQEQHDAQECLMVILDKLHEELNQVPPCHFNSELNHLPDNVAGAESWENNKSYFNNSIIYDTFYGQQQTKITCSSCGIGSRHFESFSCLSLPLPHNAKHQKKIPLTDCLSLLFQSDTEWYCPDCKEMKKGTMQGCISYLPEVLILHLLRFNNLGKKIKTLVDFPLIGLEIAPYCGDAVVTSAATTYDLYAVIKHKRLLMDLAHYTAIARRPCTSDTQNSVLGWRSFDDHEVLTAGERQVCKKDAYVLMYHRRRSPPGGTSC